MDETLRHYLENILPYRLYALSTFHVALSFVEQYPQGGTYVCSVDGQVKIQGKSTALTNPSIEMGIVHARVLLEFLGLKAKSHTELNDSILPRKTDINIESFGLERVTIEKAVAPCTGNKVQAEKALAQTIMAANKLVAHSTQTIEMSAESINSYLVTCKAIPVLFNLNFYQPLELPMPYIEVKKEKTPNQSKADEK